MNVVVGQVYTNIKHKKLYKVTAIAADCTNIRDGNEMVVYSPVDSPDKTFVRDIQEFKHKFEHYPFYTGVDNSEQEYSFNVGSKVRKTGGSFQHTGTVVSEFTTTRSQKRIVLEFDNPVSGMLHVYRPDQVEVV